MIQEPPFPSLLGRIDENFLVERHEIEMFDPFLSVILHFASERCGSNHFPYVLVDERVGTEILSSSYSKPFLFSLDNFDRCVFLVLKSVHSRSCCPSVSVTRCSKTLRKVTRRESIETESRKVRAFDDLPLILTLSTASTVPSLTLNLHHSIHTIRVFPTSLF